MVEALPALEQLLPEFLDNLPIGFFIARQGRFCVFNDCFQERLGYSSKELRAINYCDIIHPDDRESAREQASCALKEVRRISYEQRYIRKDGTIGWSVGVAVPGQYRGKPANMVYSMDITQHKQGEERRFKNRADSLLEIIFEVDGEGNFIYANHFAFDSLGYTPDDLARGVNVFQVIEQKEMAKERMQRVLSGGRLLPMEYSARRKDGSTFPVIVYSTRIGREDGHVGVAGIAIDISRQKCLTGSTQPYILQIIKAQEEERRRIARELHDETAQALASLLIDIEAMRQVKDEPSDNPWLLLEQLRLKVENALVGVRRFSHELRPDALDQLGLLPALRLLITELKERRQVNTRITVVGSPRRLSPEVELALLRIAQEALHNVEKHSLATESVVKVTFSPEKVGLQITDNGMGFQAPELLSDFAIRGKLGLIGMEERANLLGSKLEVRSEPGKGTTVKVEVRT